MKEWASKQLQHALLWRMAIIKCLLFTISTLGTSIQTACISVDYDKMSGWEKFLLWCGVATTWSLGMQMFIDKAAANLSQGKPPIGFVTTTDSDGNTAIIKKPNQSENG